MNAALLISSAPSCSAPHWITRLGGYPTRGGAHLLGVGVASIGHLHCVAGEGGPEPAQFRQLSARGRSSCLPGIARRWARVRPRPFLPVLLRAMEGTGWVAQGGRVNDVHCLHRTLFGKTVGTGVWPH